MSDSSDNVVSVTWGRLTRLLIPIVILFTGGYAFHTLSVQNEEVKKQETPERIIRTRVIEIAVQDYPVQVITQGIVQSHNEITLSAQVSGQITKISPRFEVGAYFKKNEILFELDDRDYITELKAAEASRLSAQSTLQLANLENQRMVDGFDKNNLSIVTKAEVDQATTALTRAQADLDAAVAKLDQAKLNLTRTKIRAPFDGRMRARMVGLGQTVNPGVVSAVIYAVDYAEIRFPISAREREYLTLPELEGALPIPVILRDAIDTKSKVTWNGHIVRTEGMLDEGTLELVAVARVIDPFGLESGHPPLHIGLPVTGNVIGKTLKNIVPIPRNAVRELDQIVLISQSDKTLTRTRIQPIWSNSDYLFVRYSPIFDNMWLATSYIVYAPEGATVEIIPEVDETDTPSKDDDTESNT